MHNVQVCKKLQKFEGKKAGQICPAIYVKIGHYFEKIRQKIMMRAIRESPLPFHMPVVGAHHDAPADSR